MKITGEYQIPASRDAVWRALNDPAIIKQCIPGCQSLERISDTEMMATVKAKVGPVSATFTGTVSLSNMDPPNGYTISGEGQGGAAGFAKGSSDVRLRDSDDGQGTILSYTANAQVGGKLAQVGARMIDATAKQMADQFFGSFAEKVAGGLLARTEHAVEEVVHDVEGAMHEAEERAEVAAAQGFLGGPQAWALIALVAVALLLLVVTR